MWTSYVKKEDYALEGRSNFDRVFGPGFLNNVERKEEKLSILSESELKAVREFVSDCGDEVLGRAVSRLAERSGVSVRPSLLESGFNYREDTLRPAIYSVTKKRVRVVSFEGQLVTFIDSDGLVKRDSPARFSWVGADSGSESSLGAFGVSGAEASLDDFAFFSLAETKAGELFFVFVRREDSGELSLCRYVYDEDSLERESVLDYAWVFPLVPFERGVFNLLGVPESEAASILGDVMSRSGGFFAPIDLREV